MIGTASNHLAFSGSAPAIPAQAVRPQRRRIHPEAGYALEKLGHAIEYLTDEFMHEEGMLFGRDGRLEAIELLMAVNREVYFSCPEVPTLRDRLRTFFRQIF